MPRTDTELQTTEGPTGTPQQEKTYLLVLDYFESTSGPSEFIEKIHHAQTLGSTGSYRNSNGTAGRRPQLWGLPGDQ